MRFQSRNLQVVHDLIKVFVRMGTAFSFYQVKREDSFGHVYVAYVIECEETAIEREGDS